MGVEHTEVLKPAYRAIYSSIKWLSRVSRQKGSTTLILSGLQHLPRAMVVFASQAEAEFAERKYTSHFRNLTPGPVVQELHFVGMENRTALMSFIGPVVFDMSAVTVMADDVLSFDEEVRRRIESIKNTLLTVLGVLGPGKVDPT